MKDKIPWWRIGFNAEEVEAVSEAINNKKISMGTVTEQLESELASILNVRYAVCTTSGTMALFMAYIAAGLKNGDPIMIPTRTWVATANPALHLGAKLHLIDSRSDSPVIDIDDIKKNLGCAPKVIVPVHLNGVPADVTSINELANKIGAIVIEDAAQGFMSKDKGVFLGTQARFGCFS